MLWTVIIVHIVLSASLLWATWQVWLLRSAFIATVVSVDSWNTACEQLVFALPGIFQAQQAGGAARQGLGKVQAQWQRILGFLSLLKQVQSFLSNVRQQSARSMGYGKRFR